MALSRGTGEMVVRVVFTLQAVEKFEISGLLTSCFHYALTSWRRRPSPFPAFLHRSPLVERLGEEPDNPVLHRPFIIYIPSLIFSL
jgi:hypothetical protein